MKKFSTGEKDTWRNEQSFTVQPESFGNKIIAWDNKRIYTFSLSCNLTSQITLQVQFCRCAEKLELYFRLLNAASNFHLL